MNEREKTPGSVLRERLGYSDQEMEAFAQNPRNARVLAVVPEMLSRTIVFDVIESHGCNSRHEVGTRFAFSGDGNLLTKHCPSKVCAFLLPVMAQAVFAMHELWYAGADPNQLCFRHGGCYDVGVKCGGWGRVVVEASVVDRSEAPK